jgi:hypothetical protein
VDPQVVWDEFREKLQRNELTSEDCVRHSRIDYAAFFRDENVSALKGFIVHQEHPRIEWGEEKLVYTLQSSEKDEIRLDFVVEDDRWHFYLIDGLTIPIKGLPQLPCSDWPAYPDFEHRMRMEHVVTKKVFLYLRLRDEKGKTEALTWFRDGEGHKLNIEAWMPYFGLRKSFVLFNAWIENRYWGQSMVVEELTDTHAMLLFKDHELLILYDVAGHLRPRISLEEYKELFEDQWRDRACWAGWNVRFVYDRYDTRMILDAVDSSKPLDASGRREGT